MSGNITRREFGRRSFAAAALIAVNTLPSRASDKPIGAHERIHVGLAGLGIRGKALLREFAKVPNVTVSAIVDPDQNYREASSVPCEKLFGAAPFASPEFRSMIDRREIDVVAIASPNHWHARMAVEACGADKDVYLEKPCAQYIAEGRQIIAAADKYRKVVQHGTQRRSCAKTAAFIGAVKKHTYGKPVAARVYCNKPRGSIGIKPNCLPPKHLDWNQWVGPAAPTPYRENLHPYEWHWNWNFGNGEIGNNGVHFFDLVRWALDVSFPKKALAFGTRRVPDPGNGFLDQGETPNMMVVLYDLDGFPLVYQASQLAAKNTPWSPFQMAEIHTEQGILRSDTCQFTPFGKNAKPVPIEGTYDQPRRSDFNANITVNHIANFIDCVRNRNISELNAPIEEGHRSTCVAHIGNVSFQIGRPASTTEIRKAVENHPLGLEAYDFILSNLSTTLPEVRDPAFILGKQIEFDATGESFINQPEANELLKRKSTTTPTSKSS